MDKDLKIAAAATPSKPRGRQRSVAAENAILKATLALLEKHTLSEITADAIAARAGVSKATIYKWWPNKNRVALDAILSRLQNDVPVPDTGSLLQDFTQHYQSAVGFYASPRGKIAIEFLALGQNDPALRELFRTHFQTPRRLELKVMCDRGIARGELPHDVDADLILDLLFGPVIYRILAGHQIADEAFALATVQAVFHGICHRDEPASTKFNPITPA